MTSHDLDRIPLIRAYLQAAFSLSARTGSGTGLAIAGRSCFIGLSVFMQSPEGSE